MNNLKTIFNELSNKISQMEINKSNIILNRDVLPFVPDVIETNDIYIKKSEHHYGSYRVDLVNCLHTKKLIFV